MILQILTQIASTPKRTEKEKILRINEDNELLKRVFELAYTPTYQYNMKKLPAAVADTADYLIGLSDALELIYGSLVIKKVRGHSAQDYVSIIIKSLSEEDAEVVRRVILKDLRIGCTGNTANKVWKKLIPEQPQMLASPNNEKLIDDILRKEAYAELKADGARCFAHVNSEGVTFTSRNGKEYHGLTKLTNALTRVADGTLDGYVIDGELIYAPKGASSVEDRSTGNGIVNKSSKGTITPQEQADIIFQVWDIIPEDVYYGVSNELNMPYRKRKQFLAHVCKIVGEVIDPIPWVAVKSKKEASAIYDDYVSRGFEGIILKDPDMLWENKRSKKIVKYKEVHDADLEIVVVIEGEKKNVGKLGALLLRTRCGKLMTKVGSGFTDKQRTEMWENRDCLIGDIVEINYNAITLARNSDLWSCFLPIFVEVRTDKDIPNSLEEMSGYKG